MAEHRKKALQRYDWKAIFAFVAADDARTGPAHRTVKQLTDPKALRALAHPIRLRLLGQLRIHGQLTATQAGELLGESSASCSFHLRQLAKYGLVEESGGGHGRERPWRATTMFTSWPEVAADPKVDAAADLLRGVIAEYYMASLMRWLEIRPDEPEEWQQAAQFGDTAIYVTAAELTELARAHPRTGRLLPGSAGRPSTAAARRAAGELPAHRAPADRATGAQARCGRGHLTWPRPPDARRPGLGQRAAARIPALLRETEFRRYWSAQTISMFGDQVSGIAIPLVAVLVLHASAADMGYLTALIWLPSLLFGLHAGAWVDRRGHRRATMIAADLGRFALLASVPLAYALHVLTLGQLFGVAFAAGVLSVFFTVSDSALFVAVVPADRYLEGNSLLYASRALSFVGGPSLGGLLVQAAVRARRGRRRRAVLPRLGVLPAPDPARRAASRSAAARAR